MSGLRPLGNLENIITTKKTGLRPFLIPFFRGVSPEI